jgi:hypothetical protein
MIDRAKSEGLMIAKELSYIDELSRIQELNPDVVATLVGLYRAGWRDCWEAEAANGWDDRK